MVQENIFPSNEVLVYSAQLDYMYKYKYMFMHAIVVLGYNNSAILENIAELRYDV